MATIEGLLNTEAPTAELLFDIYVERTYRAVIDVPWKLAQSDDSLSAIHDVLEEMTRYYHNSLGGSVSIEYSENATDSAIQGLILRSNSQEALEAALESFNMICELIQIGMRHPQGFRINS